jgi:hypothetical protein
MSVSVPVGISTAESRAAHLGRWVDRTASLAHIDFGGWIAICTWRELGRDAVRGPRLPQ